MLSHSTRSPEDVPGEVWSLLVGMGDPPEPRISPADCDASGNNPALERALESLGEE